MQALTGFFTIVVIIAIGAVAAQTKVLASGDRQVLSRLAFNVASAPLMFTLLAKADLEHVFSASVIASFGAIAVAGFAYLLLNAFLFRHEAQGRSIGWMLSCYSNAGNLGLPVAAYALGDLTWVAPIILVQTGLILPAVLAFLDVQQAKQAGTRLSLASVLLIPVKNPITVGSVLGLLVNVAGIRLPQLILTPLEMIGAIAVPTMLLTFGVSLWLDAKPTKSPEAPEMWTLVGLKIIFQPLVALLIALALRLPADQVRAVTVIAALPPAQNIFIVATRYRVRDLFARDTTFFATIGSAAVIMAAATLLPT